MGQTHPVCSNNNNILSGNNNSNNNSSMNMANNSVMFGVSSILSNNSNSNLSNPNRHRNNELHRRRTTAKRNRATKKVQVSQQRLNISKSCESRSPSNRAFNGDTQATQSRIFTSKDAPNTSNTTSTSHRNGVLYDDNEDEKKMMIMPSKTKRISGTNKPYKGVLNGSEITGMDVMNGPNAFERKPLFSNRPYSCCPSRIFIELRAQAKRNRYNMENNRVHEDVESGYNSHRDNLFGCSFDQNVNEDEYATY